MPSGVCAKARPTTMSSTEFRQVDASDATTPKDITTKLASESNASTPHCYFLELSRELRDIIYQLAALDALPVHLARNTAPHLFATSQQIGEELKTLYYSDRIMSFHRLEQPNPADKVFRWLRVTDHDAVTFLLKAVSWRQSDKCVRAVNARSRQAFLAIGADPHHKLSVASLVYALSDSSVGPEDTEESDGDVQQAKTISIDHDTDENRVRTRCTESWSLLLARV